MQKADEQLVQQAQMVLDFNWNGEYTQPGPRLYPHQWSWDSALIAIGYAHYYQDRAMQELSHLFENQWKNGLLPQIVFNPRFGEYFPGIDFWHAERSPDAPRDRKTSGVVQPPVHATAMLYVYRHAEDEATAKEFLEYNFPKLKAWHEYLHRERDPEGEGLVYIRHPWESGMDNSPMWDSIMERLQLWPTQVPKYQRADTFRCHGRQTSGLCLRPFRLPRSSLRRAQLRRDQDKGRLPLPGAGRALQRALVPGRQRFGADRARLGGGRNLLRGAGREDGPCDEREALGRGALDLLGLRSRRTTVDLRVRRAQLRPPLRG